MTVKMLIEELQKCNPDGRVMLHHPEGEEALFVCSKNHELVWFESASDVDLHEELIEEFYHANEIECNERDFYAWWLEKGITVELVEETLGKEIANHMKVVCEYYGLL